MIDSQLFDTVERRHGYAFAKGIAANEPMALHSVMVRRRQEDSFIGSSVLPALEKYNDLDDLAWFFRVRHNGIY